jgi:hypothetical protein
MIDDCRFKIPESCRQFSEESCDERKDTARNFIKMFVEQAAPQCRDDSNEEWTQSVRGRFINICPSNCCAVPKNRCSTKGEFLVDFIWEEIEDGRRILLAGESEWATDRYGATHWCLVEEDFEKLLAVKAPFKVLIFSSNSKLGASQGAIEDDFSLGFAMRRLEASLRNYGHHLPGEVYIFIDFPRTGERNSPGVFQSFIWLAKNYGACNVTFEDAEKGELPRLLTP